MGVFSDFYQQAIKNTVGNNMVNNEDDVRAVRGIFKNIETKHRR